jgi:hypothetical protein
VRIWEQRRIGENIGAVSPGIAREAEAVGKRIRAALEKEIAQQSLTDSLFLYRAWQGVRIFGRQKSCCGSVARERLSSWCAPVPTRALSAAGSGSGRSGYRSVIEAADAVRFICPRYSPDCFQKRNEWMVDRSARVIAVYNGEPGGTRNTIEYADGAGIRIVHPRL